MAGTQARTALEILHLKQLIADGFVGEVLSTSLIGSGGNWSDKTFEEYYYLFDSRNGATMQSIPMAHTLAAMQDVLGAFGSLDARFGRGDGCGETRPKTAPDHILIQGTMASGTALSVHYRGGTSRGTNLLWEINGTEGDIQVTANLGHAKMVQLTVKGARGEDRDMTEQMPEPELYEGKPEFAGARNVAGIYARLADDIRNGTRTAPSFADAVALHELLDAIEASAAAKN